MKSAQPSIVQLRDCMVDPGQNIALAANRWRACVVDAAIEMARTKFIREIILATLVGRGIFSLAVYFEL